MCEFTFSLVLNFFPGESVNGRVYQKILFEIIGKAEKLGLKVHYITSDMGSSNQAFWKKNNITAGRYSKINNFLYHPLDLNRKIYIIADAPHLFKNMKNMLVNNKIIYISDEIKNKNNLPTNEIKIDHINDIINYQKDFDFFLAPKLNEADLLPDHFQKMKVSNATNIISRDVSSSLEFLSITLDKPEYLTTAWYINLIERWFTLMTSRHPTLALSKLSVIKYNETIQFLQDFMQIIPELYVGESKSWKPSQMGALISTKSVLDLQNLFLNEMNYKFLLTSRLTQDCLENLFCTVRAKQIKPTALQFKNNLKLITVSQYLKDPSKSSYEKDDREFLSDFLEILTPRNTIKYDTIEIPENVKFPDITLNYSERNSLYYIAGYIISSIKRTSKTCEKCMSALGSKQVNDNTRNVSLLCRLRAYKKDALFYCNAHTFNHFCKMEEVFRKYFKLISDQNVDVKMFLFDIIKKDCDFPTLCHNVNNKLALRYITYRMKISSKKKIQTKIRYSSKSMKK